MTIAQTVEMPETDTPAVSTGAPCWICGSPDLSLFKDANLPEQLGADAFQITDSDYGRTGKIVKCNSCGFLQCPEMDDVLSFYEGMDDSGYEDTRDERALQSRKLLAIVAQHQPAGRLLDVGAGSGILVREALDIGFDAEGVEPSTALQKRAASLNLPVHRGVLPSKMIKGRFDAVTVVDVIEHVDDPVGLMRNVADVMESGGICLVVTPDKASLAAKLMGHKWWHFRVAHIGYFDRTTLHVALKKAGLEIVETRRPSWYFPASYLVERVQAYLPKALRFPVPAFLSKIIVPLNLRDSLLVIGRKP